MLESKRKVLQSVSSIDFKRMNIMKFMAMSDVEVFEGQDINGKNNDGHENKDLHHKRAESST